MWKSFINWRDTRVPCIWVFLKIEKSGRSVEQSRDVIIFPRCQDVENDTAPTPNHFTFLTFTGPSNKKQLWVPMEF